MGTEEALMIIFIVVAIIILIILRLWQGIFIGYLSTVMGMSDGAIVFIASVAGLTFFVFIVAEGLTTTKGNDKGLLSLSIGPYLFGLIMGVVACITRPP